MLKDIQKQAALLMIQGYKNSDIIKELGISQGTFYNWNRDKEFLTELDRLEAINKREIITKLNKHGSKYIEELEKIAFTGRSEKNRLDALTYLVDHTLGKATNKIQDITINDNKENKENKTTWNDLKEIKLKKVT